jgi:hypothetical protein
MFTANPGYPRTKVVNIMSWSAVTCTTSGRAQAPFLPERVECGGK